MTLLYVLFAVTNIIDLIQTCKIIKEYSIKGESNIIIKFIYKLFGFTGILIFKLLVVIGIITLIDNLIILVILNLLYLHIVYHNYKCLKEEING